MSELLNAFIFTTNENQNKILDLGKGRLAAGLNLTEICHKRLILINIQILKTPDVKNPVIFRDHKFVMNFSYMILYDWGKLVHTNSKVQFVKYL